MQKCIGTYIINKISRIYEDKQRHKKKKKKKTEGDLEKELEEMINDYEQK